MMKKLLIGGVLATSLFMVTPAYAETNVEEKTIETTNETAEKTAETKTIDTVSTEKAKTEEKETTVAPDEKSTTEEKQADETEGKTTDEKTTDSETVKEDADTKKDEKDATEDGMFLNGENEIVQVDADKSGLLDYVWAIVFLAMVGGLLFAYKKK